MCEQVVENINLAKILGVVFQEKRLFFRRIIKIRIRFKDPFQGFALLMNNLHEEGFQKFQTCIADREVYFEIFKNFEIDKS